jgi:RNA polymerase sigma-70 factor (ECF subfamily)
VDRNQILASLRERIVAYATYRIGRDSAEDLAQEVLVVLHEKYAHVTALEELVPLSLQIVRFKIMALHRKAARRGEYSQVPVDDVPLADPGQDPATYAERKQMQQRLMAALDRLGRRCREIFRLKLEGKTFAEIQVILGARSINTVYTWDLRCRKQLLELMGGRWETE